MTPPPGAALEPQGSRSVIEPSDVLLSAEDIAVGLLGQPLRPHPRRLRALSAFVVRLVRQPRARPPTAGHQGDVDAFARTLAESYGCSPATVAQHLSAVSGYYRYALSEEKVARNPVDFVRRPKVGTDTISTGLDKDELGALIAEAEADSPRSLALVLLLGLNGLRISEALGADVADLDTERGHLVLRITRKGGKRATVPLAPRDRRGHRRLPGRAHAAALCSPPRPTLPSTVWPAGAPCAALPARPCRRKR